MIMVQFSWPGKQLIKEESARGVPFFPKLAGVNYWKPEVVGLMHNFFLVLLFILVIHNTHRLNNGSGNVRF